VELALESDRIFSEDQRMYVDAYADPIAEEDRVERTDRPGGRDCAQPTDRA
jgi:hypothetical protein